MTTIHEALAMAMQHHNAGQLEQAHQIYRQILQVDSKHAEALHMMGVLAIQTGHTQASVEFLRQAIAISPENADYRNNLGLALSRLGQLEAAMAEYQRALELQPEFPEADNNLGNTLKELERYEEATVAYHNAIRLRCDFADAHNNLGVTCQKMGRWIASVESLHRAIAIDSKYAEAHFNLGISLQKLGQLEASLDSFQQAIAIQPNNPEAYNCRGHVFLERSQFPNAIASFERAIELQPGFGQAYVNLSSVYQELNRPELAIRSLEQSLELHPDSMVSMIALAHQQQWACRWDGLESLTQRVIDAIESAPESKPKELVPPFWFLCLSTPTTAQQQLKCARRWVKQSNFVSEPVHTNSQRVNRQDSKLRIGYLSADFSSHATSWLAAELFESHNRGQFQVYGYAFGLNDHSPLRRRIENGFDCFRDITSLSHPEAATVIADDKIDILVDLKGFTANARSAILAMRPAPIQVNYLGYPSTMGADFIDYILVDDFIVPVDQQPFFSERLVHLPDSYQVNDGQHREIGATPSRQDCGIPEGAFVFCSFNSTFKITPTIYNIWMRLLTAIPSSVLWLLESNRAATVNLCREAEARGVSSSRLIFAPKLPLSEHMARHRLADLFLDSYPVNAHTTASDALRMELPIVTLAGDTFVSRVAGSLLRAVGLPELVTHSLADYESLALRLGQHPGELAAIRQKLSQKLPRSSLFDGRIFAMRVERAYKTMWSLYRAENHLNRLR